jgi:hypothetical protein
MSPERPKWYDDKGDNPPWIRALADVRHMATMEGYCFQHVQAIIVAIYRPVCGEGSRQPRLLPEQALWHWKRPERSHPLRKITASSG